MSLVGLTHPFSRTAPLLAVTLGFGAALLLSNPLLRALCDGSPTDCPPTVPLSVVVFQPVTLARATAALLLLGAFWLAQRQLAWRRYPLAGVIAAGLALVVASNLLHGWELGARVPIAGDPGVWRVTGSGHEYFHDSQAIDDPLTFVRQFNTLQPTLGIHSKTHPPGAVLTLWLFDRLTPGQPGLIALNIAAVSVALSALFVHGIVRAALPDRAGYAAWLYLLLPAVQIYSLASLDALIAPLLLGVIYGLYFAPRFGFVIGFVCLLLAAWLTFGAVFIVPVMFAYEWWTRRRVTRAALALAGFVVITIIVKHVVGFDYGQAFLTAARLENPDGFRLLAEPRVYLSTRIENLLELLVFFGPALTLAAWRGLRVSHPLRDLSVIAGAMLLAMFATGAFRTGETARACLFIFPYALLPVLLALPDRQWLAGLVFGQTVLLQVMAVYFW